VVTIIATTRFTSYIITVSHTVNSSLFVHLCTTFVNSVDMIAGLSRWHLRFATCRGNLLTITLYVFLHTYLFLT